MSGYAELQGGLNNRVVRTLSSNSRNLIEHLNEVDGMDDRAEAQKEGREEGALAGLRF